MCVLMSSPADHARMLCVWIHAYARACVACMHRRASVTGQSGRLGCAAVSGRRGPRLVRCGAPVQVHHSAPVPLPPRVPWAALLRAGSGTGQHRSDGCRRQCRGRRHKPKHEPCCRWRRGRRRWRWRWSWRQGCPRWRCQPRASAEGVVHACWPQRLVSLCRSQGSAQGRRPRCCDRRPRHQTGVGVRRRAVTTP